MKKYRHGKFYIARYVLENETFSKVLATMAFVPFRVECLFPDRFEYGGSSPLFDVLKKGELVPEYQLDITEDDTGKIEVKATRLD